MEHTAILLLRGVFTTQGGIFTFSYHKFMKVTIIFFSLVMISSFIQAQEKNDYVWLMGYGSNDPVNHFGGTRIDFNGDSTSFSFFNLPYHFGFDVPCSISDENGNLKFYTNGCRIMNYQHQLVENGDDLSPGWYQSIECDNYPYGYDGYQNYMILPWPGRPGHYLYFHQSVEPDFYTITTLYSEIDMNANNGLGKVTQKNQILWELDTIGGSVSAVRHGNGRDWWVVIPKHFDNIFHFYLITPDTIEEPFIQNWNNQSAEHVLSGWNTVFSPDGRKFVRTTFSFPPSLFIYDFDRCSGQLSNPVRVDVLDTIAYAPWAAISPNSRYLYLQLNQTRLYQYDLEAADIEASVVLIGEYDGFKSIEGFPTTFHAMALAPDGKIYMSPANGIYYLHTIHSPNEAGALCDFQQHDVELPTVNSFFLPNFPNFQLYDMSESPCDTLGINGVHHSFTESNKVNLLPNPASESFKIRFDGPPKDYKVRIFNLMGQIVYMEDVICGNSDVSVSISEWPSGIYMVQVESSGNDSWLGKLIVANHKK